MATANNPSPSPPASVELTIPGFRPPGESSQGEEASPPARLPRVARLMALAVKYQEMVARGELRDYADIARLGYITRARATQVMNLVNLAPDIQEQLLFLTPAAEITERELREIAGLVYWREQHCAWRRLRQPRG
ncbi:MAG TPA: hypothetical protein VFA33_23200 [Bryobacteraceae bacterium]|nr:hypothetical protein [Bryobacteraceae bacterium]